jgi:hypothetical protein
VSVEIRILAPGDEAMLGRVAPDVFDDEVDPKLTAEFLQGVGQRLLAALFEVGEGLGCHQAWSSPTGRRWPRCGCTNR